MEVVELMDGKEEESGLGLKLQLKFHADIFYIQHYNCFIYIKHFILTRFPSKPYQALLVQNF